MSVSPNPPTSRFPKKSPGQLTACAGTKTFTLRPGVDVDYDDLLLMRHYVGDTKLNPTSDLGDRATHRAAHGMSYLESRRYQQGDEVRHIDWRVTARIAQTHTKLFHEEQVSDLVILVDLSPSMYFGSRSCFKSVCASRIAALLTWRHVSRKERCRVVAFNATRTWQSEAVASEAAVPPLLKGLQAIGRANFNPRLSADRGQVLKGALKIARRISTPGGLFCIITDGALLLEQGFAPMSAAASNLSTTVYLISDGLERVAPKHGILPVAFDGQEATLDMSDRATQDAFAAHYRQRRAALVAWAEVNRAIVVDPIDAAASASNMARILR